MKALVGAFNQEKALVGAFSVIVKTGCGIDGSFYSTSSDVGSGRMPVKPLTKPAVAAVLGGGIDSSEEEEFQN